MSSPLDPQSGDTIRGVDGFERRVWFRSGNVVTWSFVEEQLAAAGLQATRSFYDEDLADWRRNHQEAKVVREGVI